jgi:hypothetical protein
VHTASWLALRRRLVPWSAPSSRLTDIIAYRWADYDTPFWISPNRSPGRWHADGAAPTQYWSLHPLGPWAEDLRQNGIIDEAGLRGISSRTWVGQFAFDASETATITFDNAAEHGIRAADLVADDRGSCQALSEVLRVTYTAIVVPSAALPGTENLVVFGPRVLAPYGAGAVDHALDIPAAPTADGARPPVALLGLVCRRGDIHEGFRSWADSGVQMPPPKIPFPVAP